MLVQKDSKVSVVFSADEIAELCAAKIDNLPGFAVPKTYEITHGNDSSIQITYNLKDAKEIPLSKEKTK